MPNIFDVKSRKPGEQFEKSVRKWRPPSEDDEPLIPVRQREIENNPKPKNPQVQKINISQESTLTESQTDHDEDIFHKNVNSNIHEIENQHQKHEMTELNKLDPVIIGPGKKQSQVTSSQGDEKQQVQAGEILYEISTSLTLSKKEIISQQVKWENDITGIPQELLRSPQVWHLPIDFMCYLHFFSHSFGRGRRWCNMGIGDLQKFCGSEEAVVSKNTIRGSLERLSLKNLITCIEPEAPNQKSKRWLVRTPFEAGLCCTKESYFPVKNKPDQKKPRSNSEPEGNQSRTGEDSKQIQTEASTDTYKDQDRFSKRTSSIDAFSLEVVVDNYINSIRAPIARRQERKAFLEIRALNKDVTDEEFLDCFKLVCADKDFKGNSIKHRFSWMAKGFDSILGRVRAEAKMKARNANINLEFKVEPIIELASETTDDLIENISPEEEELNEFTETIRSLEEFMNHSEQSEEARLNTQEKIAALKIERRKHINMFVGLKRKYADLEKIENEARQAFNYQVYPSESLF